MVETIGNIDLNTLIFLGVLWIVIRTAIKDYITK